MKVDIVICFLSFGLCFSSVNSLTSVRTQRNRSNVSHLHSVPFFHTIYSNNMHHIYKSTTDSDLVSGVRAFLIAPALAQESPTYASPTNAEIKLLRTAFDAVYGDKNPAKALPLLSDVINIWGDKAPDERAALYRVRGDCLLDLGNYDGAIQDYTMALDLINGPGGESADAAENPTARLGRARAIRSLEKPLTTDQYKQAAQDYQLYFRLSSRDDWDTDEERERDSITRNPYAAWEWGMALRGAGDLKDAAKIHSLASAAFNDIGDKAHSVISEMDAGIDLAATDDYAAARQVLTEAIKKTTSVEGRDVELLQRVIAKEGEARVALASITWLAGDKISAEDSFYEACTRLDQLEADYIGRQSLNNGNSKNQVSNIPPFSIDASVGAGDISCGKFKNDSFLSEKLKWPASLQVKADVLTKLKKR